jgi:hypothetical protein
MFGALCRTHADRRSKHGHPTVAPVTRSEVRQYTDIVSLEVARTRIKGHIDEFFAKMREEQVAIMDDMVKIGIGNVDAYLAACDFADATNDDKDQVIRDLMCLGWHIQLNEHRFPNQDSIAIAAARVLRWSLKKGTKRTIRKTGTIDVSKRHLKASAQRHLGSILVPTFVSFGYAMAKTWKEREADKSKLKADIMSAIRNNQ